MEFELNYNSELVDIQTPYLIDTQGNVMISSNIVAKGIKKVLLICPGFSSDCIETLEEINIEAKNSFLENGGNNFDFVPCLNDRDDHINLLYQLVSKFL